MRDKVKIGGFSAMWGDADWIPGQLIEKGDVHYLMGDYLAETTMAIMARQRAKDPKAGFARDFLFVIGKHAHALKKKGIKVVCNAGGMNPLGCRDMLQMACAKVNQPLKIGCVLGDEVTSRIPEFRERGLCEMFTGEKIPEKDCPSANAYFGALPIAAALAEGCDVVVTGRVVDSALALGILMHEFGWRPDDYDRLCMGTLAGHLIECSAQCTGGLFTDYQEVKWENMGYPVVEVSPDGTFLVSKPPGTDGMVSFGSVAEQLLYEIGDPGAYLVPDVACDFTQVKIEEVGKDLVKVSGGRGLPPTNSYKVCCTIPDGFASVIPLLIAGHDAAAKARRTFETVLARTRRKLKGLKLEDFLETRFEALGAGHFDPNAREEDATEVVGKIGLKHNDKKAIALFLRELPSSGVSMAQGTTGFGATGFGGKISDVLRVFSLTVPKTEVDCEVCVDEKRFMVPVPTEGGFPGSASRSVEAVPAQMPAGPMVAVPLRFLAWARSGDKGNMANVGLIARKPEYLPILRHQVTTERVKAYFSRRVEGDCQRFDLPGIGAMNFVMEAALGGGGMCSLHSDPLAKTFGQILLLMKVDVPAAWKLHEQGPVGPLARL
ncbi:unnamed protein product [Durusdinium trenchii]|uniref:Terpene utilization protein AtuA n=2 Tax=Durusdinium trenchii TaxID=1381693 RepID=A0ABP0RDM8_9DINO